MSRKYKDDGRINLETHSCQLEEFNNEEDKRGGKLKIIPILAIILVALFFISLIFIVPYNEFNFDFAYISQGIERRVGWLFQTFMGQTTGISSVMIKFTAAALAGGALAACGAVMQGGYRNALAGPSSMGVMSGGTLGTLAYVLLFTSTTSAEYEVIDTGAAYYSSLSFFELYGRQIFALAGCVLGVALIMGIATAAGKGKLSPQAMIVSGTVFSHLLNTCFMVVQYYMLLIDPDDERIETLRGLMMGSFDNMTSWFQVLMMAVPIIICLVILISISGRLNILSMDAESARTMGVDTGKLRFGMTMITTILTAVVIAFCGQIGFLGFMLPLVGRKLVGPNMRKLVPVSMLLGAILMILVFDVAYICTKTDSLNLFTSLMGTAVMMFVLIKSRIGGNGAAIPTRGMQGMGR